MSKSVHTLKETGNKTVSKLKMFWNCFVSVSFQCANSLWLRWLPRQGALRVQNFNVFCCV